MAHWLRICLPVQEKQVRSLVWEDSMCLGGAKPMCHNCWVHLPQLLKPACPRDHALQQEKPPQWEAHIPQLKVVPAQHNWSFLWTSDSLHFPFLPPPLFPPNRHSYSSYPALTTSYWVWSEQITCHLVYKWLDQEEPHLSLPYRA